MCKRISDGVRNLKRVSIIIVVLFLTTLISVMPVIAETDQGFEWGFAYDDEIHFMMHLNGTGLQIDEEIYFVSNDTLPSIPDSMNNWTDIPYTGLEAYYANGTQLGFEILTFVAMYNVYLPIGNWTFLSTLAQTTHTVENFTLDPEDPFFWGYSWEDDDWVLSGEGWTIWSNYTLYVHVEYLKTDGFIAHYSVDAYNTTTRADAGEITLERLGMEKYRDRTVPTTDHPDDFTYVPGLPCQIMIIWHAWDENPSSYEIIVNGTLETTGLWNLTGEEIVVPPATIIERDVGVYNYTLVVYDVGGNSASDEVMVTIKPELVTTPSWVMISVIVGGLVVGGMLIVIAAVVLRRR